jgi:CHAT domain-containing protein/Flp pilus assembly protein TadD
MSLSKAHLSLLLLIGVAPQWGCGRLTADQSVKLGDRVQGALRASDPIRTQPPRGPENRWTFLGRAGRDVSISVQSYEFDIYIQVLDPAGKQIAWSDDEGSSEARTSIVLPSAGTYTVSISGTNADQYGTYWLLVMGDDSEPPQDGADISADYQEGMDWGRRNGSNRGLSRVSLAMARSMRMRRQWSEAERYDSDALHYSEEAGDVANEWAARLERGRLSVRRLRYLDATTEFQAALQLTARSRAPVDARARVLTELGNLYVSAGRDDLARVYLQTAARLAEASRDPVSLVAVDVSLNDLPGPEDHQGIIKRAEEAYSLSKGLSPIFGLRAAHALAVADMLRNPEQVDQALHLANEVHQTAYRSGCKDEDVSSVNLMSMIRYKLGDMDQTVRLAREARELTDPDDEDPGLRRVALQMEAEGEMRKGDNTEAVALGLQALQVLERNWAGQLVEEVRTQLLSQSRTIGVQIMTSLYALSLAHPSDKYALRAFDLSERTRNRSLLEDLVNAQGQPDDAQLLAKEREFLQESSDIGARLQSLRSGASLASDSLFQFQQQHAALWAARMELEAELRQKATSAYGSGLSSPITAERTRRTILSAHPNSVILDYELGTEASFLIVLGRTRARLFRLPDRRTISTLMEKWRASVNSQLLEPRTQPVTLNDYAQAAYDLYRVLLKPAARLIRGRDLIIAPSEALHDLPFDSLAVAPPGTPASLRRPPYLIESNSVSYAPSVSTLLAIESRRGPAAADQILLLDGVLDSRYQGAPDKATPASASAPRYRSADPKGDSGGAADLPGAHREIAEIADLARKHNVTPSVWTGAKGDKQNLIGADLTRYRFIHLATHGFADYQDGYCSILTLPGGNGNDGEVLTSYEISKLKLKADLVVLSACETSAGQRAGAEGTIGFTRTFLIAGAREVCGSLWPVDDVWTERLMEAFYRRLFADPQSISGALRMAKISLLRAGAPPAQWAAFTLVGACS